MHGKSQGCTLRVQRVYLGTKVHDSHDLPEGQYMPDSHDLPLGSDSHDLPDTPNSHNSHDLPNAPSGRSGKGRLKVTLGRLGRESQSLPAFQPRKVQVDPELWKRLRVHAIQEGTSVQTILDRILRKALG